MLSRLSLQQLEILAALLTDLSVSRASIRLQISQPAVSKALAKLRQRFGDPLLVRSGAGMQPTRRAQALVRPLQELLGAARGLAAMPEEFDSARSSRTFRICISDAGIVGLLPEVMQRLQADAPQISLQTLQLEGDEVRNRLETGDIDLAIGPFPVLPRTTRRRRLWVEGYVGVTRRDHPRLNSRPSLAAFRAERHVLVIPTGAHPHRPMISALLEAIPASRIALREPSFVAAAMIVKHTNFVATLPARIGRVLAQDLKLQLVDLPVALPRLPIGLYWHERNHLDEANKWLRSIFADLFSKP